MSGKAEGLSLGGLRGFLLPPGAFFSRGKPKAPRGLPPGGAFYCSQIWDSGLNSWTPAGYPVQEVRKMTMRGLLIYAVTLGTALYLMGAWLLSLGEAL